MNTELEKLQTKINGINEIKSKAREIGISSLTSEENLQVYISNESKTNPKAIEELLSERRLRTVGYDPDTLSIESHDRKEKSKKVKEISKRFYEEKYKLPKKVERLINIEHSMGIDTLKLATTKNKEAIVAALIASKFGNIGIAFDGTLISDTAEKYKEIKERNQLKQQTQQQIQANSVLQGVMLGDNLYMQEMLEEESQGMRM